MTDREGPRHLRLVATPSEERKTVTTGTKGSGKREKQLAFPYPESSTVYFVYVDAIGHEEFSRIVGDYIPRWIFDVRTVPRLDTITASRSSAFRLFEKFKTTYVDLFGRLGIKSYRDAESNPVFWATAVFDLLKNSERKGPYIFLFDNEQMMTSADYVLPDIFEPAVGNAVRVAKIRHTDAP